MRMGLVAAAAFVVAVAFPPADLVAQEREDTLPRPDTAVAEAARDTAAAADTVPATPDSLTYHELPALAEGLPAGFHTGVWTWDRPALKATPAYTLLELLQRIPGVVPLRGGDYGTPEAASAFGQGGGRLRVFWDGFELLPLDGSAVDLGRVPLSGLESVRVERGMGEVRVELESFRIGDPRPMSLVEAGTGDLDTNLFRGTFVHPRALGGSLGVALERIDTRGTGGDEEGSRTGGWVRYTWHFGDRGGIRAEYRRATTESALDTFPPAVTRSDWTLRGRYEIREGLVAEAFTGASSISQGDEDGLTPIEGRRSQHGLRASWVRGPLWARGELRVLSGPDLPSTAAELRGGGALGEVGGVSGRWSHESWEGEAADLLALRAWSRPVWGLSAFVSWESGERAARVFPVREVVEEPDGTGDGTDDPGSTPDEPEEPAAPTHRITDRTGLRVGGRFARGPVSLSGAWLRLEADTLLPFGLHTDRGALVRPGGEYTGFEVEGRIDLPLKGFYLYGAMQQWDTEARYLPERTYQGGLAFHDVFLESENFELWGELGVQGRDPMLVPFDSGLGEEGEPPILERVPFYQSWNAFIEARIVSVHILIRWDNFTIRQNNQDFPGRIQPPTRSTYGIRWTMWN